MTMGASKQTDPSARLCCDDNWTQVLDDPAPRAVRWAVRVLPSRFNEPDWGKWHYTEGNGAFTACNMPVVAFAVDGSPQEAPTKQVSCQRCLRKMQAASKRLERR